MQDAPSPRRAAGMREASAYREESDAPIDGPVCAEEPRPWVPDGEYQALCEKVNKFRHPIYKRDIVALHLRVCDGRHQGTRLERYYHWTPRVGRNSAFRREWTIANGAPPGRGEHLYPRKFRGKVFLVRTATVNRSWDGGRHGPAAYSKVAAILDLLVTNEGQVQ